MWVQLPPPAPLFLRSSHSPAKRNNQKPIIYKSLTVTRLCLNYDVRRRERARFPCSGGHPLRRQADSLSQLKVRCRPDSCPYCHERRLPCCFFCFFAGESPMTLLRRTALIALTLALAACVIPTKAGTQSTAQNPTASTIPPVTVTIICAADPRSLIGNPDVRPHPQTITVSPGQEAVRGAVGNQQDLDDLCPENRRVSVTYHPPVIKGAAPPVWQATAGRPP